MYRRIRGDVFCLQECRVNVFGDLSWVGDDEAVHNPINAYLIRDERSALFDTQSPQNTEQLFEALDELLGGAPLDYLIPSHPEAPHAGNTFALKRRYPEVTVIAPDFRAAHELYYLDDAEQVSVGDTIDLGRHVIEFCEPTFPDVSMTLWLFERTTRTLFTVDWAGMAHRGDECLRFVDEIDGDLTPRLERFHEIVLPWFRYADLPKTDRTIESMVDAYDPAVLAPSHGSVVRGDTRAFARRMVGVIGEIADERAAIVDAIDSTLPAEPS